MSWLLYKLQSAEDSGPEPGLRESALASSKEEIKVEEEKEEEEEK